MIDKEQIKCKYKFQDKEKFDGKTYCTCFCELCEDSPLCDDNCQIYEDFKQLARKTQECEELKEKYLNLKEQNGSFIVQLNTVNERLDQLKAENEELKKEIINKNEKIKELRLSVSDLTNRLCYLNAEKSFRIVDLEQTLKEIEEEMEWVVNNRECYDLRDADRCERILDIINKAKGKSNG